MSWIYSTLFFFFFINNQPQRNTPFEAKRKGKKKEKKQICFPFFSLSWCLFIPSNYLIRGFFVEHAAGWWSSLMWSQSSQVCSAGVLSTSLSAGPQRSAGGERHRFLSPVHFFFFPSRAHAFILAFFLLRRFFFQLLHKKQSTFLPPLSLFID